MGQGVTVDGITGTVRDCYEGKVKIAFEDGDPNEPLSIYLSKSFALKASPHKPNRKNARFKAQQVLRRKGTIQYLKERLTCTNDLDYIRQLNAELSLAQEALNALVPLSSPEDEFISQQITMAEAMLNGTPIPIPVVVNSTEVKI